MEPAGEKNRPSTAAAPDPTQPYTPRPASAPSPRHMPKIVTSHVHPPIPLRRFDWCAYRDGQEEAGNYGWGPTEAAAVADLLEIEEERS